MAGIIRSTQDQALGESLIGVFSGPVAGLKYQTPTLAGFTNARGEFRTSPGIVHVHTLEPIPTAGLTYDDRDALAEQVRHRMAECLHTVYGVEPALEGRARAVEVIAAPGVLVG